ncbi:MAG: pantetheine-phosphate adenylyltransferase [Anaerolineae bacterium]|nr:pantetheine-phosphate adenylyltransferase [Anaerolineae bacterium]
MTTAIYPGTFDPVHNGHVDIATRAAALFEHVTVAIYARPLKNLLFTTEEREEMLRQALAHVPNVAVVTYKQLTVDFARQVGANAIVRGLRAISDFELEFHMALTNKKLAPEIEFVCLMTSQENAFISASTVKEIAMLGGCVEGMVPDHVAQAIKARFDAPGNEGENKVSLVSLRD